ncbi:hypothetical protein ACHAPC_000414 [Botrytis cinerea]|uniref:Similar to glutathione S-transferase n=1 Tax=Botryotinia fuckeliana (strain T4) TaxID=999810 RepID=G2XY83_BOTF4|nr:similar to glutathione S-transferase [Botrytis cinerea T4]
MSLKPLTIYYAGPGPNPPKVGIILEELSIPYEIKMMGYGDLKQKPFTDLNPNGRAPGKLSSLFITRHVLTSFHTVLQDPNTGYKIWETGAIIEYLIDQYDTDQKLSYASGLQKYELKQWLFFQAFNLFHAEKLPSAQKRYVDEIHRVVGVLDGVLGQSEDGWLVGNKVTYADLAFVTWHTALAGIFSPPEFKDQWDITKYAHYKKWVEKMLDRPAVKKVLEEQQRLVAESS